ncbi:unnamed protein product [Protopolystoma xenopodis]|uniref:Uncharacterized protein n=1 Tax=Protopolystoma xenopodis TaxID=117903 RepID=A0A3S5BAS9_9PLAT|nr:unnamed protein product [Protopolystoma xenopodis]
MYISKIIRALLLQIPPVYLNKDWSKNTSLVIGDEATDFVLTELEHFHVFNSSSSLGSFDQWQQLNPQVYSTPLALTVPLSEAISASNQPWQSDHDQIILAVTFGLGHAKPLEYDNRSPQSVDNQPLVSGLVSVGRKTLLSGDISTQAGLKLQILEITWVCVSFT